MFNINMRKDWKKTGTDTWEKGNSIIIIYANTSGWVFNHNSVKEQFKTELQAKNRANNYMRTH